MRSRSIPSLSPGRERSEEHTSELQSRQYLVCRLLLEKKKIRPDLREHRRPADRLVRSIQSTQKNGREHVLTPVLPISRMPSFVFINMIKLSYVYKRI